MFRITKKLALCAGAVLVVGMVVSGVWLQTHKPMSWPVANHEDHEGHTSDPNVPHVEMDHVGLIDFGFRTGHLVPVEIRVETPTNMTLETDINCTGDMKIVGRTDESERQADGTTRYKIKLNLQSLMLQGHGADAPQNAWVSYVTLMYRRGNEKPQELKVTPIIVYPSKTYDDRKSKHAFDPELDWMSHSLTVTAYWLLFGFAGMLWCVRYLWISRRQRVPVVKPVPPPKPVNAWTVLTQLYSAVTTPIINKLAMDSLEGDLQLVEQGVATIAAEEPTAEQREENRQLRLALALHIRQLYKLGANMTWQEVSRRGQPLDSAIATILGTCEESAQFGDYPITAEDIPALEEAHAVLAAAHAKDVEEAKANAPKPRGKLRRAFDRLATWCLSGLRYLAVWKYLRRKPRTGSDTTVKPA